MQKQVSCRISNAVIRHVESNGVNLNAFLEGFEYNAAFLMDTRNWISVEKTQALLRRAERFLDEPGVCFRIGQQAETNRSLGFLSILFRMTGSMRRIIERAPDLIKHLDRELNLRVLRISSQNALIEIGYPPPLHLSKPGCDLIAGIFSSIPTMWGEKPARVYHEQCSAPVHLLEGPGKMRYRVDENGRVMGAPLDSGEAPYVIVGDLTEDGTFKIGNVLYGANACVYRISWSARQHQSWWRRPLGNWELRRKDLEDFEADLRDIEDRYDELYRKYAQAQRSAEENFKKAKDAAMREQELKRRLSIALDQQSDTLSDLSHELRTPINAIVGFSDLLLQGIYGPMNEKQTKSVTRIAANTRSLLSIINDILDYTKLESGRMPVSLEPVDVQTVADEVLETIDAMVSARSLSLRREVDDGVPDMFITDKTKLKQMLLNLISNAVKYTEEGTITLSLTATESDIRFTVADTGHGIDMEDIDRIFEKFTPVSKDKATGQPSSGLGLNITRRLAKLLDGRIEVQSELGVGSRFTIILPYLGRMQKDRDRRKDGTKAERIEQRILIVEPDQDSREYVKLILEAEGFTVLQAENLDQAWEATRSLRPSLIILEPMLPRRDGWELLRKIQNDPSLSGLPAIVHSVTHEPMLAESLGAGATFIKPADRKDLVEAVVRLALPPGQAPAGKEGS